MEIKREGQEIFHLSFLFLLDLLQPNLPIYCFIFSKYFLWLGQKKLEILLIQNMMLQNIQQKESNTAHAASNINQNHSSNKYTFPLPNIQTNDNIPSAIKNYIDEVFEKHADDTLVQNNRM